MSFQKIYSATAPSNIALIKYWGKSDAQNQWPANDSISMTLSKSFSKASAFVNDLPEDVFYFNDQRLRADEPFAEKTFQHLRRLKNYLQVDSNFTLSTKNSFPASCGIASSASSMAAITLAVLAAQLDRSSLDNLYEELGIQQISNLARLGSGSACRSLLGGYVHWKKNSNAHSQSIERLATSEDLELCDIITLVSKEGKKVSSTEAHRSAWSSPLFLPRLAGLPARLKALQDFLQNGHFYPLAELAEQEAIDLHAIAMSSVPSIRYMTEDSSQIMAWVRFQRQHHGLPAFFSLDAGPNVHILCKKKDLELVHSQLLSNFKGLEVLIDSLGSGPTLEVHSK